MITLQRVPREQNTILFDRNVTDMLKFVSCLMVAMSHYSGYALANGISSSIIYQAIAAIGGYLGVAVFFFLSGYGLMMSDQKHHLGFGDFLKRRLSKTWLPAVLVSAIWLGINMVIMSNGGGNLLCNQHYLLGVIWRFNDEVMWFVQTIIVMYLFFYAFREIGQRVPRLEFVVLAILGVIATPSVRWAGIGDPISVPLFFAGITIARWHKEAAKFFRSWWCVILVMLVIMTVTYLGRADNRVLHGAINYFCMTGLVALLAFVNVRIASLPKWVGGCSYDLYLVHYKVHLLLVFLCGVDQLWMFVVGTGIATTGFYNLRKLVRL